MPISRLSRRVLGLVGLGVALPAVLLAGLGIYLTMRISDAVHAQSLRYNLYIADQISASYEQELLSSLQHATATAEVVSRNEASNGEILAALGRVRDFGPPMFVPIEELSGYDLLLVEHQPLIYTQGTGARSNRWFIGPLLRGPDAQVRGAGGWWLDPGAFLASNLGSVFNDRLPVDTRMYGGIESTRGLSVQLLGPDGAVRAALTRDPGYPRTAFAESLSGPFTGYSVRVAANSNAPVVWADRFVILLAVFIGLMGVVLIGATFFGLRYTVRQLELAQLKSSFVSNVSHELKTPIALIRLAVETLEMRRFSSQEDLQRFLGSISREAMRLNQLVDNILDFARLEAGKKVFQFAPVQMLDVVRETVDSFRPRLEDQGFKLEVHLPDELPMVRGDGAALAQCLLNLLDNAMKYSRTRREVTVSAVARPGANGQAESLAISVQDRGIGIPAREQKSIFEKFVRIETGLVHDVKGAGLGLSLVDQIMRAHGGRVELKSTVGEGSTFTLVLPVAAEADAAQPEPRAQAAS
jgi:signal transduction histidine kinase